MGIGGFALRARDKDTRDNGRRSRRLFLESLEDRSLMAALATGLEKATASPALPLTALYSSSLSASAQPAAISNATAAAIVDDVYEENDYRKVATNFGTVTTPFTVGQLALADSGDWYRFTTTKTGVTGNNVAVNFQHAQGNLNLELYNSFGQRRRVSSGVTNTERVSLSGLAAGTYYVRVYGYLGARNPNYSLSINVGQTLVDDAYEQNDTSATAKDLGTLTAPQTISNLVMADGLDWYRFSMNAAGTASDFVAINFQNLRGNLNLRVYSGNGVQVGASTTTNNVERVSLSGLAAGSYLVQVVGVNGASNPNYSLQIDPAVASSTPPPTQPPTTGGFDIRFAFTGLTSTQRAIFEQAALKWESVIVGDLPNAVYNGAAIDDLLIRARSMTIDGRGDILAQAGPDRFRSSSRLPYLGSMEFDSADMASMEANGTLFGVILHEMGHVLGVGTIWWDKGLILGEGTSNPRFVGPQAVAAYNAIFGNSATSVPVENTGGPGTWDSHWRESIFTNELMTGWVGPGTNTPLSRITVGSLADLGYSVNYAAADAYTRPGSRLPIGAIAASFDGSTGGLSRLVESRLSGYTSERSEYLLPQFDPRSVRDPIVALPRSNRWDAADDRGLADYKATASAVDELFANWSSLADELGGDGLLT